MDDFLALSPEEQEALLKRLTHHALCKMIRLTWRGARLRNPSAGGLGPEDFSLNAIEKLLSGARTWNPAAYDTLEKFLKGVIDSDINHAVEAIDNRLVRQIPSSKTEACESEVFAIEGRETDPMTVVLNKDFGDRFRAAVYAELGDDEFLKNVFECLEAGYTAPSELARFLDMSVPEIHAAMKRLRRRLSVLEEQFSISAHNAKSRKAKK